MENYTLSNIAMQKVRKCLQDFSSYFKTLRMGQLLLFSSVILLTISLGWFIIRYVTEKTSSIRDVVVTNITGTSVTVSWVTDSPVRGSIIYAQEDSWFPVFAHIGKARAYDDRDAEEVEYGVYELDEWGEYYVHHVTLRGLEPNSKYYYKVSTGFKNVEYEYPALETVDVLDEIVTPYPVYGRVKDKEGNLKSDVLVYLHLEEGGNRSQLISTVTSDTAGWSLDLANIREENLEEMFKDRIYRVYLDFYSGVEKKEGVYVDAMKLQPVEDMVLMEEIESEGEESSGNFLRSIVGPVYAGVCPSGQWECMGSCADSGIQQMFNGTWCDGHGRWLWEAAGNSGACGGSPSRLRSEGCGGAPPSPPPPPPPSGCPSGQWECMGSCADSGIQQMFNGTWCDGHGRWLWEAAGNSGACGGNPSRLRSEGCGGAPPSPPPPPAGCPSGQWECRGSCADSGIQQMFNGTWCDGHARWLWEAAGNTSACGGDPSKLRSEGCGEAPPSPPPLPVAGCQSGEWECGESCADSGTQQLFNNTWCDGHARWLWEAAGNTSGCGGNPSKLRSEGCGGSIDPPPPQEPTIPTTPSCGANECLDQAQCWPLEEYDEHNPFGGQMGCSFGRVRRAKRGDGACYHELVQCYDQPEPQPTSPPSSPVNTCGAANQCLEGGRCFSTDEDIRGSHGSCLDGKIDRYRGGDGNCQYTLVECYDAPQSQPGQPAPAPVAGVTDWCVYYPDASGRRTISQGLHNYGSDKNRNSIDLRIGYEQSEPILLSGYTNCRASCDDWGCSALVDYPAYGWIVRLSHLDYYTSADRRRCDSGLCNTQNVCSSGVITGKTRLAEYDSWWVGESHLHFQGESLNLHPCQAIQGGCWKCGSPPPGVGVSSASARMLINRKLVASAKAAPSEGEGPMTGMEEYLQSQTVYEAGKYEVEGDIVTTKSFELNSDSTLVFFYDDNNNGFRDDGEALLSPTEADSIKEEIRISKIAESKSYDIKVGWNLFAFPFVMQGENTSGIVKASELLQKANEEGAYVTHVATFRHGQWLIYSERGGISFSLDFNILPGEGYFLKNYNATSLGLKGKEILDSVPLDLEVGWNLVGVVSPDKDYTAESLIDAIVNEGITADTVTRWESGKYENFIKEDSVAYGHDFTIFEVGGYFVRVRDKGGRFTP